MFKPRRTPGRVVVLAATLAVAAVASLPVVGEAGAYDPQFPFESYQHFPENGPNDTGYFRFPGSTVGKFYYTDQGVNKVCSASVVNGPRSGGIVYTAGHCLFDWSAQQWTTNWLFAPAADNGVWPFGTWSWKWGEAWQPYMQKEDEAYDYGVVTFFPNNGASLLSKAGGLGLVLNAPYRQHWHVWGYPTSDSQRQWVCSASWAASDIPPGASGEPPPLGVGCDQGDGMGGGPWMMQTQPGGQSAYLNSVTAYQVSGIPNALYGDYFDSSAVTMYNDAEKNG
ncbi:MAG TPA: hypothetical protein VN193_15230 [Candidatus Angelobacter sp.]|jgi:hypothetical protein|nr:hypothetical protein [Candidatus Angelobacter sp.]